MEAQKFRDFITEGEIKPYRFVLIWYDDPEDPDDPEKTADKIIEEGKKLGCTGFKVDIDDIKKKVVGGDSALSQLTGEKGDEFGPTNLKKLYLNDPATDVPQVAGISAAVEHNRAAADSQIEDSATVKLKSYITELSKYKGEDNKYISIGVWVKLV